MYERDQVIFTVARDVGNFELSRFNSRTLVRVTITFLLEDFKSHSGNGFIFGVESKDFDVIAPVFEHNDIYATVRVNVARGKKPVHAVFDSGLIAELLFKVFYRIFGARWRNNSELFAVEKDDAPDAGPTYGLVEHFQMRRRVPSADFELFLETVSLIFVGREDLKLTFRAVQ